MLTLAEHREAASEAEGRRSSPDGNRDGNDDNPQRPGATVNSHVLPARPA
jgi:hypothetical protein